MTSKSTSIPVKAKQFVFQVSQLKWKFSSPMSKHSFKAMLHEAIFLATCLATNVARQVARKISRATKCCVASCKKSINILNFSHRCETICCVWHVHRNLQRNFVKIRQSKPVFSSQEISSWRRKSCKQFPVGGCKLRTCDTPSATCNVFQSSSLRDKLQEKLPRVTTPLGGYPYTFPDKRVCFLNSCQQFFYLTAGID